MKPSGPSSKRRFFCELLFQFSLLAGVWVFCSGSSCEISPQPADRECRFSCLHVNIDAWQPKHGGQSLGREDNIDRNIFPGLLCDLDDPGLMRCFLNNVLVVDGEVQLDAVFVAFCKQHGWSNFERELRSVIEASGTKTLVRNAEWLQLLCRQRDRNPERLALCAQLCGILVDALMAWTVSQRRIGGETAGSIGLPLCPLRARPVCRVFWTGRVSVGVTGLVRLPV